MSSAVPSPVPASRPPVPLETLRLLAATVHVVPGASLCLEVANRRGGCEVVVARQRLDAALGPCGFRTAVADACATGVRGWLDRVVDARFDAGVVELGAGIVARHPTGTEERWFATTLSADGALEVLARVRPGGAGPECSARVTPDPLLDVTVVRIDAPATPCWARLDEVALRAHAACLVAELERSLLGVGGAGW